MPRGRTRRVAVNPKYGKRGGLSMATDELQEKVEHMFGDVSRVDPDVLDQKISSMRLFFNAISTDLERILALAEEHSIVETMPRSYAETVEWSHFINRRDEFLEQHPHSWPSDTMLEKLHELKRHIIAVDGSTNKAISENHIEWFLEWDNDVKNILPSKGVKYNFAHSPEALPIIFPLLRRIELSVSSLVREILRPAYDWETSLSTYLNRMVRGMPGSVVSTIRALRPTFISQLPAVYLRKLNISDRGVDWNVVLERVGSLDQEQQRAAYDDAKSIMLDSRNSKLLQKASDIFGEEAVASAYGISPGSIGRGGRTTRGRGGRSKARRRRRRGPVDRPRPAEDDGGEGGAGAAGVIEDDECAGGGAGAAGVIEGAAGGGEDDE